MLRPDLDLIIIIETHILTILVGLPVHIDGMLFWQSDVNPFNLLKNNNISCVKILANNRYRNTYLLRKSLIN